MLRTLVREYLLALVAANRSDAHVRYVSQRLDRLLSLLHGCPPSAISPETLRRALLLVKNVRRDGRPEPISDRYVFSHHAVWRAFFRWSLRQGKIGANPMALVQAPHVDELEIPVFSAAEVRALFSTQDARSFEGRRNRAMLATLFDTGMRVGELVQLEREDVDLGARVIRVHRGKSRRFRRVPLSARLLEILRAHLARTERPALFSQFSSARLFTNRYGRALGTSSVNQWLADAGRSAHVGARCSPHTFRHTFATEYLRNGGSERGLAIILGIRTRRVLDRYVHLVESDFAARQHRIASPLVHLYTRRPRRRAARRGRLRMELAMRG